MSRPEAGSFPAGVQPLDHTADIGLALNAASLPDLFHLAAAGMMVFVLQRDDASNANPDTPPKEGASEPQVIRLELDADDTALLLADWLRELLFLIESRGLCYDSTFFAELNQRTLRANVTVRRCPTAVREIKGVTYHGLHVEHTTHGWHAQVIFDV